MEPIAAVTLAVAVVVVATRAPLMVAPNTALDGYRAAIATPARVRLLATGIGALGAGLAVTAPSAAELHPTASSGLALLGWFMIVMSAWLLVSPRGYQSVAQSFLSVVTDPAALRVVGVMGTAVGAALAWLAFHIS